MFSMDGEYHLRFKKYFPMLLLPSLLPACPLQWLTAPAVFIAVQPYVRTYYIGRQCFTNCIYGDLQLWLKGTPNMKDTL